MNSKVRDRRAPLAGSAVIWPSGIEVRYNISAPTRWRWEKSGRLPARDVNVGGKTGWRPSTIEAAENVGIERNSSLSDGQTEVADAPPPPTPRIPSAFCGVETHDSAGDI